MKFIQIFAEKSLVFTHDGNKRYGLPDSSRIGFVMRDIAC